MKQVNPIIISRENGTAYPWLHQAYLLTSLPTLTETYLRVRCRPLYKEKGAAWKWKKIDGEFYYHYEFIPNKAPNYYRSQLLTRYELIDMAGEVKQQAASKSLSEHFTDYLNSHYMEYLHLYGGYNERQQAALARAAAMIQGCIDYITINKVDIRKKEFWFEAATLFATQDAKYIPHNFRCLKDKVTAVMQGDKISDVIKLPREGNDNRSLYNDEEVKAWILQLRGMGQNFTNSYIIRKVQYVCYVTGKPVPSERWIGGVMEEPNTNYLTALGRYGENGRQATMYKGYVPLQNAMFAGDCWQIDGTRVNIIDHKHTRVDGTKKQDYLFIVCVRDVHSGDILGYSLGIAEDRWMYLSALKMAVKETGYLPYQLVRDRFPGHNTDEYISFEKDLTIRGVKITETSKETGKAQLERHFDTWQTVFMQDSPYYYGQGILSRRKFAHRSEEYLKNIRAKARKDGWDFDAACNETERLVHAYRTTALNAYSRKHKMVEKSPVQLHQDSEKPHVINVSPQQITYLFGLKKELQLKNGGLIKTEIQKYHFIYRTTNHSVVANHSRVMVVYELEDLSTIHLYEISDKPVKKYLGTAEEVDAPQIYGPDAEMDKLSKQKAIVASMNQQREEEYQLKMAAGSDIVSYLTPNSTNKHKSNAVEDILLNTPCTETTTAPVQEQPATTYNDDVLNQL